jgi:hypothetical protein
MYLRMMSGRCEDHMKGELSRYSAGATRESETCTRDNRADKHGGQKADPQVNAAVKLQDNGLAEESQRGGK